MIPRNTVEELAKRAGLQRSTPNAWKGSDHALQRFAELVQENYAAGIEQGALLKWLGDRHPHELEEYRFKREYGEYVLLADEEIFIGATIADVLQQAAAFLKPSSVPLDGSSGGGCAPSLPAKGR